MKVHYILDPVTLAVVTSIIFVALFSLLSILYHVLKNKNERLTETYLCGEPESVISHPAPSISSLYWGFMKKFAKKIYDALIDLVHTGNIQDWAMFMTSWMGLLILISIIVFALYIFTR
ncbi:MAG: sodium:proton antiporter [Desulfurococcaceae archaeon]